jgi:hypothetical protein
MSAPAREIPMFYCLECNAYLHDSGATVETVPGRYGWMKRTILMLAAMSGENRENP